jgi:hypothetical protein
MTVIWNVVQMQRNLPDGDKLPDGLVTVLHWTAQFAEASSYGSVGLGAPDPDNWTPFGDITEEQAIQWTKDALGPETVSGIEESLLQQEQRILNPTTADGLPW